MTAVQASWWAVVIRISHDIEGEGPGSTEEYSLRIVKGRDLSDAKQRACAFVLGSNPNSKTTDGKTIIHRIKSIVGAEHLGVAAPKDGDEIWSKLAFLEREEDQSWNDDAPPFWALRAFHTDWNTGDLEERA